jgi:hypothetical protein
MSNLPRYVPLVLEHLERIGFLPSEVHHVEIAHEDDCRRPDGGPCGCTPRVVSGPAVDRKHGGAA